MKIDLHIHTKSCSDGNLSIEEVFQEAKKRNITKLVYYEISNDVEAAIVREKQIKGWLRRKKIALIESVNQQWKDLSKGWFRDVTLSEMLREKS